MPATDTRDAALAHVHDEAVDCLMRFRQVFRPEQAGDYELTLVARNKTKNDGSRDIVVTQEKAAGPLVDAIQRRLGVES